MQPKQLQPKRRNVYLGCFTRLVLGSLVAAIVYAIPHGIWWLLNGPLPDNQRSLLSPFWGVWWAAILVLLLVIYVGKTTLDALI